MTPPLAVPPDPSTGLTSAEAGRRLELHGLNEPATAPRTSGLMALLGRLRNPLVIILLLAAAASASLGEVVNAIIIAVMVVAGVLIDFLQTYRSQRAADKLKEQVT